MLKLYSILYAFFCCSVCLCQTKEEVYRVDIFQVGQGDTPEQIARYWNSFAIDELQDIREIQSFQPTPQRLALIQDLEETLSPILSVKTGLYSGSVEQRAERQRIYLDALQDNVIAEEAFQTLGPDYCLQKTTEKLEYNLANLIKTNQEKNGRITSLFESDVIAERINLDDRQIQSIKSRTDKYSDSYVAKIKEFEDKILKLRERRWEKILNVLNSEQRKEVDRLVGRPLDWFLNQKQILAREMLANGVGSTWYSSKARDLIQNGIKLEAMKEHELDELDIVLFSPMVLYLLREPLVGRELELITDQKSEMVFDDVLKKVEAKVFGIDNPKNRLKELFDGKADYPKLLKDVLLPNQVSWLRQIEFQIRLDKKHDISGGVLDPRFISFLSLDDKNQQEIKSIVKDFEVESKLVIDELRKFQKKSIRELNVTVLSVLSDEQQQMIKKLVGKKFYLREFTKE